MNEAFGTVSGVKEKVKGGMEMDGLKMLNGLNEEGDGDVETS